MPCPVLTSWSRYWIVVVGLTRPACGGWKISPWLDPQSLTTLECGFGMTALIRLEPHEGTLLI